MFKSFLKAKMPSIHSFPILKCQFLLVLLFAMMMMMLMNFISFGFGLLVGQNKTPKYATMGFGRIRGAFLTTFQNVMGQTINRSIKKMNCKSVETMKTIIICSPKEHQAQSRCQYVSFDLLFRVG